MATLGDPLADLAWFLQNWGTFHAESGNPANYVTTWSGARTREEMLARYARRTGRSLDHELFYRVFCMWKSIIITEGLYSGFLNGDAANPAVARFVTQVPDQVDAVHALLECARA
jgi:aminoglycoside phosphotransferase (APT) family kinase protein